MSWASVGNIISKAAPVLATALADLSGAIAGAAGALVASALGCEADANAVQKALATNPEAMVKLKALEVRERQQLLDWQA